MRAFVLILIVLCIGCSSNKETVANKTKYPEIEKLTQQKEFVIESDWALPLTSSSMNIIQSAGLLPPQSMANRINLIGNPNYFKVQGDSIAVYLPFFGDRQLGGGYTSDGAIKFEGIPKKYEVSKNEKKQRTEIKVTFRNSPESHNLVITLYKNHRTEIVMYSSHRTAIRYTGKVRELEKDDENKKVL